MGSQQVICYTLITILAFRLRLLSRHTQNMKLCLFLLLSLSTSYCQAKPSHKMGVGEIGRDGAVTGYLFGPCKSDADCPEQTTCRKDLQRCWQMSKGMRTTCDSNADCPEQMPICLCTEPLWCNSKKCTTKCTTNEDCPNNGWCTMNGCL